MNSQMLATATIARIVGAKYDMRTSARPGSARLTSSAMHDRQRDRRGDRAERKPRVVLQRLPEDRVGTIARVVVEADEARGTPAFALEKRLS